MTSRALHGLKFTVTANAADPPKRLRDGSHHGHRRPPCSRCGSLAFRGWFYVAGLLVCARCYFRGLEGKPSAPPPATVEEEDTACSEDPDGVHHIGCGCETSDVFE